MSNSNEQHFSTPSIYGKTHTFYQHSIHFPHQIENRHQRPGRQPPSKTRSLKNDKHPGLGIYVPLASKIESLSSRAPVSREAFVPRRERHPQEDRLGPRLAFHAAPARRRYFIGLWAFYRRPGRGSSLNSRE